MILLEVCILCKLLPSISVSHRAQLIGPTARSNPERRIQSLHSYTVMHNIALSVNLLFGSVPRKQFWANNQFTFAIIVTDN